MVERKSVKEYKEIARQIYVQYILTYGQRNFLNVSSICAYEIARAVNGVICSAELNIQSEHQEKGFIGSYYFVVVPGMGEIDPFIEDIKADSNIAFATRENMHIVKYEEFMFELKGREHFYLGASSFYVDKGG